MIYWLVALAIVVLSYLAGFSIGFLLLPVGLAMLVLGPFRHRPAIYWPPMSAVLAFIVGFLAVAPLYCSSTTFVSGSATSSTASCSSLIGITYAGTSAPRLPGVYAGAVLAALAALLVASGIWWVGRGAHSSTTGEPR